MEVAQTRRIETFDEFIDRYDSRYSRRNRARLGGHSVERDELPPDHPFSNIDKKHVDMINREIRQFVETALKDSPKEDPELCKARYQSDGLSTFHKGPSKMVVVLGDQGIGKTSLLNCLFHIQGIGTTDVGQGTCTKFPVEYQFMSETCNSEHKGPFAIVDVYFYTDSDITDCVDCLTKPMKRYMRTLEKKSSKDQESSDSEQSEDEKGHLDDDDAKSFQEHSERLEEWIKDLGRAAGKKEGQIDVKQYISLAAFSQGLLLRQAQQWNAAAVANTMVEASDTEKQKSVCSYSCQEATKYKETRTRYEQDGWGSMVKKMVVKLPVKVLSEDVTVVDLPGTGDAHGIRAAMTKSYCRKADLILMLIRNNRLKDDDRLKKDIRAQIRHMGVERIILVPTKIDELATNKDAQQKMLARADSTIFDDLRQFFKYVDTEIERAESMEQLKLEDVLKDEYPDDTAEQIKADMSKYKEYLDQELVTATIEQHRRNLTSEIADIFRDNDKTPLVVPTCTQDYWKATKPYSFSDRPRTSLSTSGILDLRRTLIGHTYPVKLCRYQTHATKTIPQFLNLLLRICAPEQVKGAEKKLYGVIKNARNSVWGTIGIETVFEDGIEEMLTSWVYPKGPVDGSPTLRENLFFKKIGSVVDPWKTDAGHFGTYKKVLKLGGYLYRPRRTQRINTTKTTSTKAKTTSKSTASKQAVVLRNYKVFEAKELAWALVLEDRIFRKIYDRWRNNITDRINRAYAGCTTKLDQMDQIISQELPKLRVKDDLVCGVERIWFACKRELQQSLNMSKESLLEDIEQGFNDLALESTAGGMPDGAISKFLEQELPKIFDEWQAKPKGQKDSFQRMHNEVKALLMSRTFNYAIEEGFHTMAKEALEWHGTKLVNTLNTTLDNQVNEVGELSAFVENDGVSEQGKECRMKLQQQLPKLAELARRMEAAVLLEPSYYLYGTTDEPLKSEQDSVDDAEVIKSEETTENC